MTDLNLLAEGYQAVARFLRAHGFKEVSGRLEKTAHELKTEVARIDIGPVECEWVVFAAKALFVGDEALFSEAMNVRENEWLRDIDPDHYTATLIVRRKP